MSISPLHVAGLALVSYVGLQYLQSRKKNGGLPPGPPGMPIIGVSVHTSGLNFVLNAVLIELECPGHANER